MRSKATGSTRACHIGGDFLLTYPREGDAINFVRTGMHAQELFGL